MWSRLFKASSSDAHSSLFEGHCSPPFISPYIFPITLYVDNIGAISPSKEFKNHGRSKHIDIRYHFIREFIEMVSSCPQKYRRHFDEGTSSPSFLEAGYRIAVGISVRGCVSFAMLILLLLLSLSHYQNTVDTIRSIRFLSSRTHASRSSNVLHKRSRRYLRCLSLLQHLSIVLTRPY